MARLLAQSNINFTDASWKVIEPTTFNISEAGSNTTTTSYQASNPFTPGAITAEGILLRINSVENTGTFSIDLAVGGVSVTGTEVTCNTSDISTNSLSTLASGFVYFKFAFSVKCLK